MTFNTSDNGSVYTITFNTDELCEIYATINHAIPDIEEDLFKALKREDWFTVRSIGHQLNISSLFRNRLLDLINTDLPFQEDD